MARTGATSRSLPFPESVIGQGEAAALSDTMKIKKKTMAFVLLLVIVIAALLFIFFRDMPADRPLVCAQCGREATHRIKAGSWIIGLCDNCYKAIAG
ncbi:MAG: hypothetical protein IJ121_08250 [Eubacterium sp.]|nr:hypothetical protein [Eubacterium sp.]